VSSGELPPRGGAGAEPVPIEAADGRVLAGLWVAARAARGALVVNGATGFPREFYLKFAGYCATRGYSALVYDYRGTGASAAGPPALERARMSDWGRLDMPAALGWLAVRCPGRPLATLGHSIGGQLIGCMPNEALARAHLLIATSTGYWRLQRVPFRYQALLFWKVYGPLALARHGCVPTGWVWRGTTLPREVFLEWREWCLRPDHFAAGLALGAAGFGNVRTPLLSWSFSDDPIATPAAVEALLRFYPRAAIERRTSTPAGLGVRAIGHHGFFAERHRDSLWRGALDWIEARCR
jgi:predicted alpha/beta hydrolase